MERMAWIQFQSPVSFPRSSGTPSTLGSTCPSSTTTPGSRRLTPSPRTFMYPDHGSSGRAGGVTKSCVVSSDEEAAPANYGALVDEHIHRACEAANGAVSRTGAPGATPPSTLCSLLSSPDVKVAFGGLIKVSNSIQQVHLEIKSLCGTQQLHANLADASFRPRVVAAYLGLRCITQIAEATIVPHPDNLFVLLCMYSPLADLFDFASSMFLPILEQLSVDSRNSFNARFHDTLLVLRSNVRCCLDVLETRILGYPSKQVRAGGSCSVDEITEYLIKYIMLLLEHSSVLSIILASGMPEQEVKSKQSGTGMETLKDAVAVLISCLETALETKSRLYLAADGLQWLFMVNNLHHILKQLESSEIKSLLGEDWILKRREHLENYISRYIDIAWVPILSCLQVKAHRIPLCFNRPALPALSRFNLKFEETYSTQKAWKVDDPQLRKRMRGAVTEKIVPTYRLFLEKHRSRPPKYISTHLKKSRSNCQSCMKDDDQNKRIAVSTWYVLYVLVTDRNMEL